MKVLNFIFGMIVGMVLLVVAICGAIFAAGSLVNVGQLENTLGTDIFDDSSEVNDKTLLQLASDLIKDLQDKQNLTINKLRTKYGLKIPTEISGIDISVLFDLPITEVPDNLGEVVNNMTLRDVGEFLKMDFENDYNIPVLKENLDNKVNVALDNVLNSIDDDKLTIASIESNFGISLGSNAILDKVYYTPLSQFGSVIDLLTVNDLMSLDSNLFVRSDGTTVYVNADEYVEISASELADPDRAPADGAETFIAGVSADGTVIRRELCFVATDGGYIADNSCYFADFDASANKKTFYRHVVRKPFSADTTYPDATVLSVASYLNCFVADGNGSYAPADGGYFALDKLFVDETMSLSVSDAIIAGSIATSDGKINLDGTYWFASEKDGAAVALPATSYGVKVPAEEISSDTRFEEGGTGYILVHEGTADMAIQAIAGETIKSLANATDKITALKLGEIITIDASSAKILQTLKDTPVNKLSEKLDTIVLSDATDIVMSQYVEDENGSYVLTDDGYYTLYRPGMTGTRYKKLPDAEGTSSTVLQRLAHTAIPDISNAFADLILGDALAVDVDAFEPVGNAAFDKDATYYVFDETYGYPKRATDVTEDNFDSKKGSLYIRTYEGTGNAVLKQLAYVKVDETSVVMDSIVKDTLLSDIIDVAEYAVVKDYASGERMWIIENDSYYSVDTDKDGTVDKFYVYVYDGNGKYYRTNELYELATASQIKENGTKSYNYTQNSSVVSTSEFKDKAINIYYYINGEYKRNDALTAYYIAQSARAELLGLENPYLPKLQATFSREIAVGGSQSATVYKTSSRLYVNLFGEYVLYNPNDATHLGEELNFRYTDGYYVWSGDNAVESNKYYFDYATDTFIEITDASSAPAREPVYIKLPDTNGDGNFYFAHIDTGNAEGKTTYSKRECEYIFKTTDKTENAFVFYNGEYVPYDAANDAHNGLQCYERYLGYLGNDAANTGTEGGGSLAALSNISVEVITEQSPTLLLSLLAKHVSVGELNNVLNDFTLGEMMEIEEGSIFDDEVIKNATIENLSSTITARIAEMTMGELIRYSSVKDIDAKIRTTLENVRLADFLAALKFDTTSGQIVLDMEKLIGVA